MLANKYNLDLNYSRVDLESLYLEKKIEKIRKVPIPKFAMYSPQMENLKRLREKYKNKKNIIVEGNGGAISNFEGIYQTLGKTINKNVFLLDTEDPDYIYEITKKCKKKETLAILTSKSGTRIQVLANYFALKEYPLLIITEDNDGALNQIRKIKKYDVSFYPKVDMTDRFTGITESALTAAEIVGIDAEDIIKGGKDMYSICKAESVIKENPALQLALVLDKLEKAGYTDLFLSIYSKRLTGFYHLLTQLFHESVCKNGLGQTIYGGEAPENQHHTLQRLIAGRKNSAALFLTIKNFSHSDIKIKVEKDINDVPCRNIAMEKLDSISLEKIIKSEFEGTWQDVIENKIPAINFEIENISPCTIGGFMAFFQYAAFYSALLRNVNPCDQPGVEKSKENIFRIISGYSR